MKSITTILRKITFGGSDPVLRLLGNVVTKVKVSKILKKNQEVKLEIGSGKKKGVNGWVTLDMGFKIADLNWDLRNGIPFPDESLSMIYSSHLFEHLTFNQAKGLLKECRRALKKNGVFSIAVPNARLYIDSYVNKDDSFWASKPSFYASAYNNTTRLDLINYVAYMDDEHKYMFDEENLVHILRSNGFREVGIRNFDPSIDKASRQHETVYASGIK